MKEISTFYLKELLDSLSQYTGVIPENILVTNGSDDALILLCRAFLKGGSSCSALVPCPTYEHFCSNVTATGARLIRLELKDPFHVDLEEIIYGIEQNKPNIVYLISPNNPTGTEWDQHAVKNLSERFPSIIFIVDEAYHEFASIDKETGKPLTVVKFAVDAQNVIVTRTFSKAFCLASVRGI